MSDCNESKDHVPELLKYTMYVVKEIGLGGLMSLILVGMLTGLIPSPLKDIAVSLKNLGIGMLQHSAEQQEMRKVLADQQHDQIAILMNFCWNAAKSDDERKNCMIFLKNK